MTDVKKLTAWFTRYTTTGVRYFQQYELVKKSENDALQAIMPISELMDCDMLANGFDFNYIFAPNEGTGMIEWQRQKSPDYLAVIETVPVGRTMHMALTRARLYQIGHSRPSSRIRIKLDANENYLVHKDDLEVFWSDDWVFLGDLYGT